MASDPNVGVPDADVVYGAKVRLREPTACRYCNGEEWVTLPRNNWGMPIEAPCPVCCCQICGSRTDVIGGECGMCADEADRYAVRRADR